MEKSNLQNRYNSLEQVYELERDAHITALEQHLSDMRLIVFGHYLKAEVKDVKKDQKPVQG